MTDNPRRPPEVWTSIPNLPKVAARAAVQAEVEGWDGVLLADSQNMAAELMIELALCAAATERIMIAPGVTNPVTRHPAVLAGAMATLQAESGGRAVLGIGRGDSALAHIGFAPASVSYFERYLRAVQAYLDGDDVALGDEWAPPGLAPVDSLRLGTPPPASRLNWVRPEQPKVPVDVAAAGPRMIAVAASLADSITFSVGANPERVAWAIDHATAAQRAAGRAPGEVTLGAYVNIVAHPDLDTAQRLVRGNLASFSRFSVMHGEPTAAARPEDEAVLRQLHGSYDMTNHGYSEAGHLGTLTDDFADRNAVLGDGERCLERLRALWDLGIDRFVFMIPAGRAPEVAEAREVLVDEVINEMRRW
jgi:5,10-methylenetetrahydromethanopterin reductase